MAASLRGFRLLTRPTLFSLHRPSSSAQRAPLRHYASGYSFTEDLEEEDEPEFETIHVKAQRRLDNAVRDIVPEEEEYVDNEPEETEDSIWDGNNPEPFDGDEITSMAHSELEMMRELREFNRVQSWDMPLLWNHRKTFNPPDEKKTPLRWRYTSFMGEEHPGTAKVVVDFAPTSLDLTPAQTTKLIKLLGPRYDPLTSRARMSSQRFPSSAQNKRFLGDMVDRLIAEAKDPKDMFEDIPLDFRASKRTVRKRREAVTRKTFPEEWKMTDERRAALRARWKSAEESQKQRALTGRLVDGLGLIEGSRSGSSHLRVSEQERQPVMAGVRR